MHTPIQKVSHACRSQQIGAISSLSPKEGLSLTAEHKAEQVSPVQSHTGANCSCRKAASPGIKGGEGKAGKHCLTFYRSWMPPATMSLVRFITQLILTCVWATATHSARQAQVLHQLFQVILRVFSPHILTVITKHALGEECISTAAFLKLWKVLSVSTTANVVIQTRC